MAERRMFSTRVVCTDKFTSMPERAQCLYFQLVMHADDDGFISSPRSVLYAVRCDEEDLAVLAEAKLIYIFSSGVIVIRHWNAQNKVRKALYCPTVCEEERELLTVLPNGLYTFTD